TLRRPAPGSEPDPADRTRPARAYRSSPRYLCGRPTPWEGNAHVEMLVPDTRNVRLLCGLLQMRKFMTKLTLAQANKIIEAAFAEARKTKVKPLAVAVLDEAGHVRSLQREDGASMFRNDVATGKAWAAVGMGASSRTLLQRAKENPHF